MAKIPKRQKKQNNNENKGQSNMIKKLVREGKQETRKDFGRENTIKVIRSFDNT